jgi:hypothetical protein
MNNLNTLTDNVRINFQCTEANIITDQLTVKKTQLLLRKCQSLSYSGYSSLFMESEIPLLFGRILAKKNCNKLD